MDMQKIAAWRLLRETRAEFGERLATELWEDLPYLSPRMVAMPWHNDTTAKLIATLTNGAEVWAWLESRHRDEREEYDGDRFAVYAYRDNAAALAGEPVWEDSSEEAGALWEMIENAIKAVKA